MKEYRNILFDLDGTLIDSKEGIINAIKYALQYLDFEIPPTEELDKFIGPPIREPFEKYYNLDKADTEIAVEKFREFYKVTGVKQTSLYPGIIEMLKTLKNNGKKVLLVTSKTEFFARQILDNLGIFKYFDFVTGATFDGSRAKKGDLLKYTISKTGISAHESIMVGDKKHDIIGAKEVGMDSIGVLYGYGSLEELKDANAGFIASNVMDILEAINLKS